MRHNGRPSCWMTPIMIRAAVTDATELSANNDTCAGTSCLFLAYYLFFLSDIPSSLVFRVDKGERLSLIYSAWRAVQASFPGILTGPAPDPYQPAAVDKPWRSARWKGEFRPWMWLYGNCAFIHGQEPRKRPLRALGFRGCLDALLRDVQAAGMSTRS